MHASASRSVPACPPCWWLLRGRHETWCNGGMSDVHFAIFFGWAALPVTFLGLGCSFQGVGCTPWLLPSVAVAQRALQEWERTLCDSNAVAILKQIPSRLTGPHPYTWRRSRTPRH